ncbi:hypothetical protein LIER_30886 [Lithospermum erythrorhizon]|uniref:Uncharacterized protein n=1 Tax=Lithospermum erythrorhizon TaxID=34254 RepID=A0AAV3RSJ6_LITER
MDLTKDPLPSTTPKDPTVDAVPLADSQPLDIASSKGKEVGSKNAFRATRPLLLEEIGKAHEDYNDPFEIQGSIAKHLIKATNASHVMARRLDRLDEELDISRENERNSQFRVHELEKENEDLLWNQETTKNETKILSLSQETKRANEAEQKALMAQESARKVVEEYRTSEAYHEELREETAYCLCLFLKTFKDVNPSLATILPIGFPLWILMSLYLLWKVRRVRLRVNPNLKIRLRLKSFLAISYFVTFDQSDSWDL